MNVGVVDSFFCVPSDIKNDEKSKDFRERKKSEGKILNTHACEVIILTEK